MICTSRRTPSIISWLLRARKRASSTSQKSDEAGSQHRILLPCADEPLGGGLSPHLRLFFEMDLTQKTSPVSRSVHSYTTPKTPFPSWRPMA